MSDREDKKLNLGDELADVKSLIAGAEDGGFSLDDILAEYGVKSPRGAAPSPCARRPRRQTAPTCPGRRPPSPSEPRQRGGLPRGRSSTSGGGRPRPPG